jgi:hypothetical protein
LISSETEYEKAREELDHLARWLARLETAEVTERKGLTSASVRRMISRVQQEIAEYEAAGVSNPPGSENTAEPGDASAKRPTKGRDSDLSD